jgi:hypothetical protein
MNIIAKGLCAVCFEPMEGEPWIAVGTNTSPAIFYAWKSADNVRKALKKHINTTTKLRVVKVDIHVVNHKPSK